MRLNGQKGLVKQNQTEKFRELREVMQLVTT